MVTLHLNLKKKWFDMILSGEKTEEYRDITEYWKKRLTKHWEHPIYERKSYDTITFSNGYSKNRRQFVIKYHQLRVGKGKHEWGADYGIDYFKLYLGKIISTTNCG